MLVEWLPDRPRSRGVTEDLAQDCGARSMGSCHKDRVGVPSIRERHAPANGDGRPAL